MSHPDQRRQYDPVPSLSSTSDLLHAPQAKFARRQSSAYSIASEKSQGLGTSSVSSKFSLPADPAIWGIDVSVNRAEPDDYLHNPDPRRDRQMDKEFHFFNSRALANLGCLAFLALGIITLFAGYPFASWILSRQQTNLGGFNLGGINASGQVPSMLGDRGLIDMDTPREAYTKASWDGRGDLRLVFSDEFNVEGRTFWPGDDPYWEAVDLHYWGTNNMEWYGPDALRTRGGALEIALTERNTHDRDWEGGMMSTWNKFCFTGGLLEAAVTLPGSTNVQGLWPAFWAMGNLGRAGYGATLDGTWPFTYDSCDVGTVANQSVNGLPVAARRSGAIDPDKGLTGELSYMPGQRLSRCTCEGESHPGPIHRDGSFVGRAAPEIDVFEAQVKPELAEVSQSGQWAPFNAQYEWFNTTDNLEIYDAEVSFLNTYVGAVYQQASSVVSHTNPNCYQIGGTNCFSEYAFEYKPGFDDSYITWINDGKKAWTIRGAGMAADPRVEIGARPVPVEPMYILLNLGMSENFGFVDIQNIVFPSIMRVDYIRVYQHPDEINVGCDPEGFPTKAYIDRYIEAYTNPNLTTWEDDFKQTWPKNKFLGQC